MPSEDFKVKLLPVVQGQKGGKGSSGGSCTVKESTDTLVSHSYAEVAHLLCEGEIEGLVNGAASVFLNKSPLVSLAGDTNTSTPAQTTTYSDRSFRAVTLKGQNYLLVAVPRQDATTSYQAGWENWLKSGSRLTASSPHGDVIPPDTYIAYTSLLVGSEGNVLRHDDYKDGNYYHVMLVVLTSTFKYDVTDSDGVLFKVTYAQNSTGSISYLPEGITRFAMRLGTPTQSPIAGFDRIASPLAAIPSAEISTFINPVPVHIADTEANSVSVSVYLQQLMKQNVDDDGVTITPYSVEFDIYRRNSGEDYQLIRHERIYGKCSSLFVKSYVIDLPAGTGPWDIKIVRTSENSKSSNVADKLYWYSVIVRKHARLNYAYSAVASLVLDASQYGTIPQFLYHLKLMRVQVPANYNPVTREYATTGEGTTGGVWDGTWKVAWTDNPSYCFRDFALSGRYGTGDYLGGNGHIDDVEIYEMGRYCDQLVPDGYGGQEPRMRLHIFMKSRMDAMKALAYLAQTFKAMSYWAADSLRFFQDRPAEPKALFTNANVVGEQFIYSSTAVSARHTVALVKWYDPENFHEPTIEVVFDEEGVRKFGVRELEMESFGPSRAQARRDGRRALYTELYETESVTFETSLDAALQPPGTVIAVIDNGRVSERYTGRLKSATSAGALLDSPINFQEGKIYRLYCVSPQGNLMCIELINPVAETDTVAFASPIDPVSVPLPNSVFGMSRADLQPKLFRLMAVEETSAVQFKVLALEYNAEKYAWVDNEEKLSSPNTTQLPDPFNVPPPVDLSVALSKLSATALELHISWSAPQYSAIAGYVVSDYHRGVEEILGTTRLPGYTIKIDPADYALGSYLVAVQTLNLGGIHSTPAPVDLAGAIQQFVGTQLLVVRGLQVDGTGNLNIFQGKDATFTWNEIGAAFWDAAHPQVAGFRAQVYASEEEKSSGAAARYTEDVTTCTFEFTYVKNALAFGVPRRSFYVEISVIPTSSAVELPEGSSAGISVTNPLPSNISALPV